MSRSRSGHFKLQPPKDRCGYTGKIRFRSHEATLECIAAIFERNRTKESSLRAYKCNLCGGWHMTKH
jgi:hypothetical protein